MEIPLWMGGAAAIGIIAGFWQHIKSFLLKIVSIFVVSVSFERYDLKDVIVAYCCKKIPHWKFGNMSFSGGNEYIKPKKRTLFIGYEDLSNRSFICRYGYFPFILGAGSFTGSIGAPPSGGPNLKITFIRGTINLDKLIEEAIDYYNDIMSSDGSGNKRFRIVRLFGHGSIISRRYSGEEKQTSGAGIPADATAEPGRLLFLGEKRFLKWQEKDIGTDINIKNNSSAFDMLAFPPKVVGFYEEIKRWKESEAWYREKGILWRRGWILSGKPGVGKTCLVKAIGYDLDLPIYSFDLSTMSNNDLVSNWKQVKNAAPAIALIEDIDGIFQGRDNRLGENGGGLTFDCLLNCMGGIEDNDGVFLIITTNNIKDLDPAIGVVRQDKEANGACISTRPGRIDRVLELELIDEKCRRKIAERILNNCPGYIEEMVKKSAGDTAAQAVERYTQVALNDFWERKNEIKIEI